MNRPSTLLLILLAIILFLFAVDDDADGATPKSLTCEVQGVTSGWIHSGDPLTIGDLPFNPDNRIPLAICRTSSGIRYLRATGDTASERSEMVRMARSDAKPDSPIIVCDGAKAGTTYLFDLAYYYFATIKRIHAFEAEHYAGWAQRKAARQGCQVYR